MRRHGRTETDGRGGFIRRPGILAAYSTAALLPVLAATLAGCASAGARMQRAPAEAVHAQLASSAFDIIGNAGALEQFRARSTALREALRQQHLEHLCRTGDLHSCRRLGLIPDDRRSLDRIEVVGSRISAADVITNNQESGVDEGDIVKKSGRFLFVLRQGWLHVVDTGTPASPALALVQSLQVATDPTGETVWYDEILAFGDRLVLIGYNFEKGVAELLSYAIDHSGRLQREARYWIRVPDYYSASNYLGRIEGENLLMVLTMPLDDQAGNRWPAWSNRDDGAGVWQPLVDLEAVHLPVAVPVNPVIHMVVRCPFRQLRGESLACATTGVVGERGSISYVSPSAVYLAVEYWPPSALLDPEVDHLDWRNRHKGLRSTIIYRFPFAAEEGIGFALFEGLAGSQFTFVERNSQLHAALTKPGPESSEAGVLLLQSIATGAFGSDPDAAAHARIDARVSLDPSHLTFRFTDHGLLIGPHSGALLDELTEFDAFHKSRHPPLPRMPPLLLQRLDGAPARIIETGHTADQVESVYGGVALSGRDQTGRWTVSILAPRASALVPHTLTVPGIEQTEGRSHAFNHTRWHDGTALLGWPVSPPDDAVPWSELHWRRLGQVSDLALFRWDGHSFGLADVIEMQHSRTPPKCKDPWGCEDWYGNARLFFFDSRIFALSGPRLVEASWDGSRVTPLRSVDLP